MIKFLKYFRREHIFNNMNATNKVQEEEVFETQKEQFMFYLNTDNPSVRNYDQMAIQQIPRLSFKPPSTLLAKRPTRRWQTQPEQLKAFYFSRNFESGNLQSVRMLPDGSYRLKVSMDCNSQKQSQWFYFACRGLKKAKFRIVGFVKSRSLYSQGMKVCVNQGAAWTRGGEAIHYGRDDQGDGYALTFSYKFRTTGKTFFAYSFPYTYTDLKNYIRQLEKRQLPYLSVSTLGTSLLEHPILVVSITSPNSKTLAQKQTLILTARVHPGQSVSSHLLHGFIEALLSNSKTAQLLRQHFIFRIIPMLNPDGVIMGNYRLSYSGADLNRKWKETSKKLHKEIYELKRAMGKWDRANRVRMIIDLHGHSRKKGVFFYGCQTDKSGANVRQFPYLMSTIHPSYHYQSCNFTMPKSMQGTQRISMHHLLKLAYVYTLQASFCGDQGTNSNYSIENYNEIGSKLVEGMFFYLSKEMVIHKPSIDYLSTRSIAIEKMYTHKQLLEVGRNDDSGSDSCPSEGCYKDQQLLVMLKLDKEKPANNPRPRLLMDKPRRQSLSPHIKVAQCKLRVINGSVFDKERRISREDSQVEVAERLKTESELEDSSRKGVQYQRVKRYAEQIFRKYRLKTCESSADDRDHEGAAIDQLREAALSVNNAAPSFYPTHKLSSKDKKRSDTVCLKPTEKAEHRCDLKITPAKQCRKLRIRHFSNF